MTRAARQIISGLAAVAVLVGMGLALVAAGAGPAGAQGVSGEDPAGGLPAALAAIEGADASQVRPADALLDPLRSPDGAPVVEPTHQLLGPTEGFGQAVGHQAQQVFAMARWTAEVAEVAVRWALGLRVWRLLLDPAQRLADVVHHDLLGPLGLVELALLAVMARTAWLVFASRAAQGGAELLTGLLLATAGTLGVAHVDDVACAGLAVLDDVGHSLVVLVVDGAPAPAAPPSPAVPPPPGAPPPTCGAAKPVGPAVAVDGLVEVVPTTLVHGPHQLLQWGEVPAGDCATVAVAVRDRGAWRDPTVPVQAMRDAGCEALADHAAQPDAERVVAGVAHLAATGVVAGAVVLLAGTVLLAQVGAALLVMTFPVVALLGVAPAGGRRQLGRWVATAGRLAVSHLLGTVLLVGVLAVLHTVEAATGPDEVVLRLGLAVVVGGAVLALHRRAAGGWLARGGRPGRWSAGRGGRPAPGRAMPTTGHGLPAPGAAAPVGRPG